MMKISILHIFIGPALIALCSLLWADELLLRVQRVEAFSNTGYGESSWSYLSQLDKKLKDFSLAADFLFVREKSKFGGYRGRVAIQDWMMAGLKNSVSVGDGFVTGGELSGQQNFRGLAVGIQPAQNDKWQLKTFGGLIPIPQAGTAVQRYSPRDIVWGADFLWKPVKALPLRQYFSQRLGSHNIIVSGLGASFSWWRLGVFTEVSGSHRAGKKNRIGFAGIAGVGYAQGMFSGRLAYFHFDSTFTNLASIYENPKVKDQLTLSLGANFYNYLQLNINGFGSQSAGCQNAGSVRDYSQGGSGSLKLSLPAATAASLGYEVAFNDQVLNDSLEAEIFEKENTARRFWAELSKDLKYAALSGRYQDRRLLPKNDSLGQISKESEWESGIKSGQWKGCCIYFGYVLGKRNNAFGKMPSSDQPWTKYKANLGLSPIKYFSLNLQAELTEEKGKSKTVTGSVSGNISLPYSFKASIYYRPYLGLWPKENYYKPQYLSIVLERRIDLSSDEVEGSVFIDANKNGKRDRDETGIPGIRVKASGQGETVTDNQGRYRFINLRPKDYDMQMDLASLPADYTPISPLVQVVATGGLTSRKANFAVSVLGTVKGQVFIDENNNGIYDNGETGVSEVIVVLKPEGLISVSNGKGLFRFTNVPVNEHYASLDLSSLPPDFEARPRAIKVKVNMGQEIEGLDFPVKRRVRTIKKLMLSPIEGIQAAPIIQRRPEPAPLEGMVPPAPKPERRPVPRPGPKASPQDIEALFKQATSLYIAEKYEEAATLWKRILRLDPGNAKAQKNLERTQTKLRAMGKGR